MARQKRDGDVTLVITVDLGHVGGHKKVEVFVSREDYDNGKGGLDRAALEETAREILFDRVISWDWHIAEEP